MAANGTSRGARKKANTTKFKEGNFVYVKPDMSSGINRPGGKATIDVINNSKDPKAATTYNVKYVIGRNKLKNVSEEHIVPWKEPANTKRTRKRGTQEEPNANKNKTTPKKKSIIHFNFHFQVY